MLRMFRKKTGKEFTTFFSDDADIMIEKYIKNKTNTTATTDTIIPNRKMSLNA